jgi:translocation and assembly module TamA
MRFTSMRGAWQKTYGMEYRWDRFEVGPDSGSTRLLTPLADFTRMMADDPVDTRHGFKLAVHARGGVDQVLSDVSFLQLSTLDQGITRVGRRNRLIGRVEAAWTYTKDFRDLPRRCVSSREARAACAVTATRSSASSTRCRRR